MEHDHHRILAAVDGSEQALQAIRYVSRISPPGHTEVVLFHVMSNISENFWALQDEAALRSNVVKIKAWELHQQSRIKEFCQDARQCLLDEGYAPAAVTLKIREKHGGIARDIEVESTKGYDAVVLGRKGTSELKDMVVGSVAHRLVERLAVPLWVIGGSPRPGKVLLCVDKSETATAAADHLASMLHDSGTEVVLFHAVLVNGRPSDFATRSFVLSDGKNWVAQSEGRLAEELGALTPVFDDIRMRLVRGGMNPANIQCKMSNGDRNLAAAIVSEAEREGCDTIVVGRRNLSKFKSFFANRLSNRLVQIADRSAVWIAGLERSSAPVHSRPLGSHMPDTRER
jgi:nucleotide-binding universal stress UspA family protein